MSDSPSSFKAKAETMFDAAEDQLVHIGKEFTVLVAADAVLSTPGLGNQLPIGTTYEPTGRLRGGWSWDLGKRDMNSRDQGGPYDLTGQRTAAAIAEEIRADDLVPVSYLNNDVSYGWLVHEGLENHAVARRWTIEVAQRSPGHFRTVMGI